MRNSGATSVFAAVLAGGILLGNAASAEASDVRPFEPRFQQRVDGDISIVTDDAPVSTVTRPAGSALLFAGLYWGGAVPAGAGAGGVRVQVGSAAPTLVLAEQLDTDPRRGFGAVADVTELFRGTGPSVDLSVDEPPGVGWSLITAWSSPTEPLRDLRIVDGLASVTPSDPASFQVSGLSTPRRGAVDTSVGVVSHGAEAEAEADVHAGDTTATVPVQSATDDEILVAAVTTASRAAAVTDLRTTARIARAVGLEGIVTVTVGLTNSGPDDQTGPATLTVTPDGVEPDAVSLSTTSGTCGLARDRAVCAVAPLRVGDEAVVTFAAKVTADAPALLGATAQALPPRSDTDPEPANDTARTELEPPAP